MQQSLLGLDYWFFELINQKGSFEYGNLFFPWVTDLHHSLFFKALFVPFILFFFVKNYKKSGLLLFFVLLLAVGTSDGSGGLIKNQVLRLRPFENSEIVATQKSPAGSKSFYSNHSSNMFTLATYTSTFIPQLKIPLFAIALCVGYSRIYNGVHYPSDVLAGAFMGLLWGYLFSLIGQKILKTLQKKEAA